MRRVGTEKQTALVCPELPHLGTASPQLAGMVGRSTSEKWPFLSNILVRTDLGKLSLCGILGTGVDKTEWSKLVLREKRWIIVTSGVCVCVCVCVCVRVCMLSHVQLFAAPWTAVLQAPLSMGFSGKNTGVGCHARLQGIFLT